MVAYTMLGLTEVEYEVTHVLSIGTIIFDLGWPWTVLVQGHQNCTSSISKLVTDTMMESIEVE